MADNQTSVAVFHDPADSCHADCAGLHILSISRFACSKLRNTVSLQISRLLVHQREHGREIRLRPVSTVECAYFPVCADIGQNGVVLRISAFHSACRCRAAHWTCKIHWSLFRVCCGFVPCASVFCDTCAYDGVFVRHCSHCNWIPCVRFVCMARFAHKGSDRVHEHLFRHCWSVSCRVPYAERISP